MLFMENIISKIDHFLKSELENMKMIYLWRNIYAC